LSLSLKSAYLLTYDHMIDNTKKWVDLGLLNGYYVNFSAFRFGEIIVAHRTTKPDTGINMLTWDGENLEDHGVQIDLNGGIFLQIEMHENRAHYISIIVFAQKENMSRSS
jgi:hypothetical protein